MAKQNQLVCGVTFSGAWNLFDCHRFMFLFGPKLEADPFWRPAGTIEPNPAPQPYTGGGRFEHAVALGKMLFPKSFEWNDWSMAAMRSFCDGPHSAVTGCAGSSKSTTAALFAFLWMLASPDESAVLIVSTSIEAAKKRIWKPLQGYYNELTRMVGRVGNTVLIGNPRPCIRSSPKDSAHGIYVVAVAKGEVDRGIESLKGFHPKRLLMIGDETDSVSQAVVDVEINQQVGTLEYKQVWLGNDPSMFNPLGRLMEPEKGKPVTLGHSEWISTKGLHCLRFDAMDSPNLQGHGDKWAGIVRQKDIDAAVKNYGGENTPQFWIMMRGLHPPEGADNTVLSEALFLRHRCADGVVWEKGFELVAMLDPAFGGDKCVFRTAGHGRDVHGQTRVLLMERIALTVRADEKGSPAEYQIAAQVKALCEARGIPPQNFILDVTGTGRGVASVLKVQWSPDLNECEFGGACSDMPVSDENPKPAREEYDRKVTELWYSIRQFVQSDMLRGMDEETAVELCQRRFVVKNKKIVLERKDEMKLRGLHSPDYADALACGIHLLREKGVNATVQTAVKTERGDGVAAFLRAQDLDGSAECYSEDLEPSYAYADDY